MFYIIFRFDYKISDYSAEGIVYDNGTTQFSLQVFQCTCTTSNVTKSPHFSSIKTIAIVLTRLLTGLYCLSRLQEIVVSTL
jgi:hypothetical protein